MPKLRNSGKVDSNPVSLNWESVLSLSYHVPHGYVVNGNK